MNSPDPYQTRPSLLRRVKDRDESGWLHFYQQYRPLILWMMSRRGLYDRASTDTVIQAVMLHFAKLDWDYDSDRGRFRNLVLKVTEFKIRDLHREKQRQERFVPLNENLNPAVFDEDEEVFDDQREGQLARALAALCEDEKIPAAHLEILTQALQGRNNGEITEALQLNPGQCAVIKHRMLQRLRQQMEPST
jgi:RNA polymerase sigma factor (sigma-70 family)